MLHSSMFIPFLIGLCLTLALIVISSAIGLDREKGVYPATLIAIALFYVVFAVEHGDTSQIISNIIVTSLFMGLAIIGYVKGLWLIALGLILHGLFDVAYLVLGASPAPEWWGPLCLAVDIVLGAFLIFLITKKKL